MTKRYSCCCLLSPGGAGNNGVMVSLDGFCNTIKPNIHMNTINVHTRKQLFPFKIRTEYGQDATFVLTHQKVKLYGSFSTGKVTEQ